MGTRTPVRRRHSSLAVLFAVACLVSIGFPAAAYWSAGQGTGSALVNTLNAPTAVTASSTPGTSTVNLSWTGATLATGEPAQGYDVERFRNSDPLSPPAVPPPPRRQRRSPATTSLLPTVLITIESPPCSTSWTAVSLDSNNVVVNNDSSARRSPSPRSFRRRTAAVQPREPGHGRSDRLRCRRVRSRLITYWVDLAPTTTVPASTAALIVAGEGVHTVHFFATDNSANAGSTGTRPSRSTRPRRR